jgi:hypothetical protein
MYLRENLDILINLGALFEKKNSRKKISKIFSNKKVNFQQKDLSKCSEKRFIKIFSEEI